MDRSYVRFGSKAAYAAQRPMSALPPIADICSALAHVRSGPVETAYVLMQFFKNALLFEPLSFCSFACFRQATDFAALCSSCWVGLMLCATRIDFDVASDELCALAGSPASPRTITKILADTKRRNMSVPP
jgi:hypothetical protein